MKKGWQIILAAVSIMVLLGGICIGVGFITGAEPERIATVLDNRYNITIYYEYVVDQLVPALDNAGVI